MASDSRNLEFPAFDGSILLISARSPFARRVRLAFLENHVRFEERLIDVLRPTAELLEKNPLARVPTLVLRTGESLMDSNAILGLFYGVGARKLSPRSITDRLQVERWSVLAAGVCEKIVEFYFEGLRPEASRDPELLQEIDSIVHRVLSRLESFLEGEASGRQTVLEAGLSQADLDLGVMLAYLTLRYPLDWAARYPYCSRYLASLDERPSFVATRPPK